MKIICTKEEFAAMLSCCIASTNCGACLLFDICEIKDNSTLIEVCEIKEPEE